MPTRPSRIRENIGFVIQLAVLGLMLFGVIELPDHVGESAVVGAGGAVVGWHG